MTAPASPHPALVMNAGSATLKAAVFVIRGDGLHRLATTDTDFQADPGREADYTAATGRLLDELAPHLSTPWVSCHRLVHGGGQFGRAVPVDADILATLAGLSALAPLHQPPALAIMDAVRALNPAGRMAAVFDTGLFTALPAVARRYALPVEEVEEHGLVRYGFHGLAHDSLRAQFRAAGGAGRRLITLQLGGGCSATAFLDDRPIDTSMGFTPAEGLVMGTRCGSVDAGVLLYLQRAGWDAQRIEDLLNRRSGLLGVSGLSDDMRALLAAAADGNERAALAIDLFCYRARLQIGAYAATLNGLDGLVFGGGIGFGAAAIRARICTGLDWLGVVLDPAANADPAAHPGQLAAPGAAVRIGAFETDEAPIIAREGLAALGIGLAWSEIS